MGRTGMCMPFEKSVAHRSVVSTQLLVAAVVVGIARPLRQTSGGAGAECFLTRVLSVCNHSQAQRRRSEMQLRNLERERPLDFFPVDVDHDGEEYTQKFLQLETEIYQAMAARLMSNYMFLCDPYIPVQSAEALEEVKKVDGGKGKLYSLGGESEVNALFYLPVQEAREISRPLQAVNKLFVSLSRQRKREQKDRET